MTPYEAYCLIKDIEADYIRMVKDLNRLKNKILPVDPWKLPLVERMEKAMNDLALAGGFDRKTVRTHSSAAEQSPHKRLDGGSTPSGSNSGTEGRQG